VRVLTLLTPHNDTVHIGPISLKVPVGSSNVDIFGAGSIAAPVDIATGALGLGTKLKMQWDITHHPTTGLRIDHFSVLQGEFATILRQHGIAAL
jgi:hypothetical protein